MVVADSNYRDYRYSCYGGHTLVHFIDNNAIIVIKIDSLR